MPGKAQKEKNLYAAVSDSCDCRTGSPTTSDNLRAPGDATCYRWRTRCERSWRKTFATQRRTIMTNYIWQLVGRAERNRRVAHDGQHSRHRFALALRFSRQQRGEVGGALKAVLRPDVAGQGGSAARLGEVMLLQQRELHGVERFVGHDPVLAAVVNDLSTVGVLDDRGVAAGILNRQV